MRCVGRTVRTVFYTQRPRLPQGHEQVVSQSRCSLQTASGQTEQSTMQTRGMSAVIQYNNSYNIHRLMTSYYVSIVRTIAVHSTGMELNGVNLMDTSNLPTTVSVEMIPPDPELDQQEGLCSDQRPFHTEIPQWIHGKKTYMPS
ncbi:uncharacterized protein LOC117319968 [Pecten maximus]|uniref:uncharacterized protein LOC117319968 n=1 Tax=Pecten maximus TaxID=6579 RepID=UPI0014583E95|nr:uncharacterized protein LOC117319968 [Pecten maximus]